MFGKDNKMALIKCPECNHDVSDTAESCPNCGFSLSSIIDEGFEPEYTTLSEVKKKGSGQSFIFLIGSIILLAIGVPLVAAGIGIVFVILGVIGFFISISNTKKVQYGKCPYCGTDLQIETAHTSFKCPACNNIGKQTQTRLYTTHKIKED